MSTHTKLTTLAGGLALMLLQCAEQQPAQNAEPATPPPAPVAATEPAPSNDTSQAAAPASAPKDEAAATASKPVDAPPSPALNDAQIGAITEGANSAEIEQAKLARSKSKNQKVLQFASMMITHHQDAQRKQAKLKLTTAESPLSAQMTQDANQTLASLKEKTGADFDRAYMRAQVEEHQALLDAMNTRLLTSVSNAELKAYLEEVKTRVEQHLEAARTNEASLTAPAPTNRPSNAASSMP
jgi:putative membrane protein